MANPEKTNAKNIDKGNIMVAALLSLGGIYNTTETIILIAELQAFFAGCQTRMLEVNDALPVEKNAIASRFAGFKPVRIKTTTILNAAKAQNLEPGFIANLTSTANVLRGVHVGKKTPDNPLTPENEADGNNSSSHRSFAAVLQFLDLLIEQLKTNKDYKPNETELQTASLTDWLNGLIALNAAAINSKTATIAARTARDEFMYNDVDGLFVRVELVKAYIRSILPPSHPVRKQISKLNFAKP